MKVNRTGLITFCGSNVEVQFDIDGPSGKETFKFFEDGKYSKTSIIKTKHPNIVKSVITGKKGWGLWRKQWSEGIREGSFLKQDIFDEFSSRGIIIPESFLQEFLNSIYKI